jgi:hypothetical protein
LAAALPPPERVVGPTARFSAKKVPRSEVAALSTLAAPLSSTARLLRLDRARSFRAAVVLGPALVATRRLHRTLAPSSRAQAVVVLSATAVQAHP